jgi:hypothetical protein
VENRDNLYPVFSTLEQRVTLALAIRRAQSSCSNGDAALVDEDAEMLQLVAENRGQNWLPRDLQPGLERAKHNHHLSFTV